jgi:hypothetical protein
MTVVTCTWLAVRGFLMRAVMELKKCGDLWVDLKNDVATFATIATIWSAEGLELLTQNRCAAIATIARLRVQLHAIDEGGHS